MKQRRWYTCDLVKAVAILMVFMVHSASLYNGTYSAERFHPRLIMVAFGQFGVQLFLMVSGFLAVDSWRRTAGKHRYLTYAVKRWKALAVPYILATLILLAVNTLMLTTIHDYTQLGWNRDPGAVISNVLMVHGLLPFSFNNVGPIGWFVGTLWILCLLYPLMDALLQRMGRFRLLLPAGAAVFAFVLGAGLNGVPAFLQFIRVHDVNAAVFDNNGFYYCSFLVQLPCYLIGAAMRDELEQPQGHGRTLRLSLPVAGKKYALELPVLDVVGAVLGLVPLMVCWYLFFRDINSILQAYSFTLGAWLIIRLLLRMEKQLQDAGWDGRTGTSKLVHFFAAQTYPFALVHCVGVVTFPYYLRKLVGNIPFIAGMNMTVRYLIMLPVMFAVSVLITVAFDRLCKQVVRLLDRLG